MLGLGEPFVFPRQLEDKKKEKTQRDHQNDV
jgi:hypothetical protein